MIQPKGGRFLEASGMSISSRGLGETALCGGSQEPLLFAHVLSFHGLVQTVNL